MRISPPQAWLTSRTGSLPDDARLDPSARRRHAIVFGWSDPITQISTAVLAQGRRRVNGPLAQTFRRRGFSRIFVAHGESPGDGIENPLNRAQSLGLTPLPPLSIRPAHLNHTIDLIWHA